jgi:hypothetical protein
MPTVHLLVNPSPAGNFIFHLDDILWRSSPFFSGRRQLAKTAPCPNIHLQFYVEFPDGVGRFFTPPMLLDWGVKFHIHTNMTPFHQLRPARKRMYPMHLNRVRRGFPFLYE